MANIWDTIKDMTIEEVERIRPDPPAPLTPPNLSVEKIQSILLKLRQPAINNGLSGIAESEDTKIRYVRMVERSRRRRIRQIAAEALPEEP